MLPLDTFKAVVALTPLISIDLIVRNDNHQVLVGKRLNRPAQNFWFVPGGRVLKDESVASAFQRLLKVELGIQGHIAKFKGIYQHFYDDNISGTDFGTHYVVLAYEVKFNDALGVLPKDQHSDYKWLSQGVLLKDDAVHKHTKWYFQKKCNADASFLNFNI